MLWYEILIIVLACAFVAGVAIWQIVRRKKGKGGCCDCQNCSHCASCKSRKDEQK